VIQDKSALVVLVPEAEPIVADLRAELDVSGRCGLPAHVTVLVPFAPPARLTAELRTETRRLFAKQAPFEFSLEGVCGFRHIVYLAPQPFAPFDALTRATADRFPEFPPYRGVFAEPTPHLTVAQEPLARDLDAVAAELVERLAKGSKTVCRAREVALAVKRGDRWSIEDRFSFGVASLA
jgi:hypothetical protein